MGQQSTIEWTDHTFNPWWGCTKISPGCTHCYAETWSERYGHDIWGPRKSRRTFSEQHWQEPLRWNRLATQQGHRMRVFCASMADVFEDNPSIDSERHRLWSLIAETPMLDWLLLTKRPENMLRFTPWKDPWPSNIWAMTSVENQEYADERIPTLIQIPTIIRGLSVEPLLGPVDLRPWLNHIQWVIVGGESGREARPINPLWVRDIREQCLTAKVPFFFKQWGEWSPITSDTHAFEHLLHTNNDFREYMHRSGKKASGRLLDDKTWDALPFVVEAEHSMKIP